MLSPANKLVIISCLTAFIVLPMIMLGDVTGADPRLTAAPGEGNCTSCHLGTALNRGGGSVNIALPNGATYTPGTTQRVQVQISDATQRRWGFQLSARVGTAQAGTLRASDTNAQVRTSGGVQYITHTLAGTRNGTTGNVTFEFDWTPPSNDVGPVTLYAAANAANGNNQNSGDHIYTTNLVVSPAAATTDKPAISADRGVVNGASFQSGIAASSWITITGDNLAKTTREWSSGDFVDGKLPTSLDGVSVAINGKPAYIRYVSPTQINALAPADDSQGTVEVRVTAEGQTSDARVAALQPFSPALFTVDGKYLAATHANNALIGKSGLFASAPALTTPARPGETVILYGTGFGPTDPAIPAGQFTDRLASITTPFTIMVGGLPAAVSFGGLVPPYAGLYQFNVAIPEGVADGDQPVIVRIGGVSSAENFITVQR